MGSVLGVEKGKLRECLLQLIDRELIVSKDGNKTMYKLTSSAIRTLDARLGTYCPYL